jgi:hypothetical protein
MNFPAPMVEKARMNTTQRPARSFAIVAIYAFIGPPIAAIAFLSYVAAHVLLLSKNVPETIGEAMSVLAEPAIYGYAFAGIYSFGIGPAVTAGSLIAIMQAYSGRVAWPMIFAGGIVGGSYHFVRVGGLALLFDGVGSPLAQWSDLVISMSVGVVSTAVCWAIARRWQLIDRLVDVAT